MDISIHILSSSSRWIGLIIIVRSSRTYFSYISPGRHVEYTSEIASDGAHGPRFVVTAMDDPDHPVYGITATACWSVILNMVRKERARMGLGKTGTAVSGPEFFGFAMPEVAACIEGLEGSDQCKRYICRCLRLDSGRKKYSCSRRTAPITYAVSLDSGDGAMGDGEQEEKEERPVRRKAAKAASRKWQIMQIVNDQSSDKNDDDTSDASLDSEEEDRPSPPRRSIKRKEPVKAQPVVNVENMMNVANVASVANVVAGEVGMMVDNAALNTQAVEEEEAKRIRMEQLF